MENQKISLSAEKFEVKVEIEASYLMYDTKMSKEKALKVARDTISQRYQVS